MGHSSSTCLLTLFIFILERKWKLGGSNSITLQILGFINSLTPPLSSSIELTSKASGWGNYSSASRPRGKEGKCPFRSHNSPSPALPSPWNYYGSKDEWETQIAKEQEWGTHRFGEDNSIRIGSPGFQRQSWGNKRKIAASVSPAKHSLSGFWKVCWSNQHLELSQSITYAVTPLWSWILTGGGQPIWRKEVKDDPFRLVRNSEWRMPEVSSSPLPLLFRIGLPSALCSVFLLLTGEVGRC